MRLHAASICTTLTIAYVQRWCLEAGMSVKASCEKEADSIYDCLSRDLESVVGLEFCRVAVDGSVNVPSSPRSTAPRGAVSAACADAEGIPKP